MAEVSGDGGGTGQPGRRRERLQELADLRERVVQLEADIVECRVLNERLTDITDAVAEALLPAGQRDDARIRDILARNAAAG